MTTAVLPTRSCGHLHTQHLPATSHQNLPNLYVRHPATRALCRLVEPASSLDVLREHIEACTGIPTSIQGALRCEQHRSKPIHTLPQLEGLAHSSPVTVLEVTCAEQGRAGLLGGKGGFGSLLRSLAKNTSTTNFGSCRDLQGRRLRHVQQEEEIARWTEEQKRKGVEQKKGRGWQKEYIALKKTGHFLEKRMCTFGADCRYKWKCRYRHPGDDEAEQEEVNKESREKVVQGPLKNFFGHINKPLKGVIGVTTQRKAQNDIMAGLKIGGGKTRGLKRRRVGLKRKRKPAPVPERQEEEPAAKKAKTEETPSGPVSSDDDDLGFEIGGALPSSARNLLASEKSKTTGGSWGEKAEDLAALRNEKDLIIPIDADFKETRKRLKKERRRRHREREAQLRAEKEKKMVGGWLFEQEPKKKAADKNEADDDMYLGDLFNDNDDSKSAAPAAQTADTPMPEKKPVQSTTNEDEIDLDGLL